VSQNQQKQDFSCPSNPSALESQKQLLLNKFRQAVQTRGVRGFITLKRKLRQTDVEQSGLLDLNQFLQAFDEMQISNVQSSELKMCFDLYDSAKIGRIEYAKFMQDLTTELSPFRQRLVQEAFHHLDANKNGVLDLYELKNKFNPNRHPDVLAKKKTVEEARFEFQNLFTSMHSANRGFRDEPEVSLDDFLEWHAFINTQIERDCEFRNLLIGVWNMDVMENNEAALHSTTNFVDPSIAGLRRVAFPARNSHE
jgi:hypothetical protein